MMRKKIDSVIILLALLIFIIGSLNGNAQSGPLSEQWNRTFGGADNDTANSVQATSDGGYIIAGITESFGAGGSDAWLIKTDANGVQQWSKTFGGAKKDNADAVQQTSDDGYIVAGITESFGAGGDDVWLIKTDANGNQQWSKTFGGTDGDAAFSVRQTSDDGYIIAGATASFGAGQVDVWLIKTDSNGNQQWSKSFGGTDVEWAESIRQTTDGGYILTGWTYSYGAGNGDVWLIKTDSSANQQWSKTFGDANVDEALSVQQTLDGGYILAGGTGPYGAENLDVWLIKTDSNGIQQWNKKFGGKGNDDAISVQQTSDGGYILVGYTFSYGAGRDDAWLIKTDAKGTEQWNMTLGGTRDDRARSVQQIMDGGYILAGVTSSYGTGKSDAWLVKVSPPLTPTPAPTPTLTPTLSQTTPALTPVPAAITATPKTPGFAAVFAVLVLVIAYLIRKE